MKTFKKFTIKYLFILFIFLLSSIFKSAAQADQIPIPISKDTYVEENFPTVSPWNNKNIYIGRDLYYNKGKTRAYFKFKLDQLKALEIKAEDIEEARLYLYQYGEQTNHDYNVDVWEIGDTWNEYNISWINQPFWRRLTRREVWDSKIGWKSIEVTRVITKYLEGYTNNGIMLKFKNENQLAGIFWSKSCQHAPTPPTCSPSQKPYIQITYGPNQPPTSPRLLKPSANSVTNNTSVVFRATESTDPEGEDLKYKLMLSQQENFSTIVYETNWQPTPSFIAQLNEGQYFWKVLVQDQHGPQSGQNTSDISNLQVDTTSPTTPAITPEPPFTDSTQNEVCWSLSDDNLERPISYKAESSEDNFATILESTGWQAENCHTFRDLKDGQNYQYRVQAKDTAGNTSELSEITNSTQDTLNPQIANFRLSPRHISPANKSNINVQDQTQIKIQVTDTNLRHWSLIISNSNHEKISIHTHSSNDLQAITWPPTSIGKNLPEGSYFLYIEAEDKSEKISRSDSIELIVDNTNPQKPQIISPKADSFTNKIPTLKVRMDKNSANSLALNGLRMKKYKVSSITESLKNVQEGLNTITAESVDAAGNRSSNEISFTYDTQKPAPPQITLKPDNTKKTLSIEITGEKNTIAYIYVNQNLQKNIKMRKGRTQIRLIDKWKSGKVYSISARLKDRAGNLSSPSEIAEFIAPDQDILGVGSGEDKDISYPQPPAVKTCHLEVNKDKKEFNQRKCKTNSPKLVHIINHGKGGETYWVDSFGTVQSEIELEITHKYCKKKTFFDPRTWFSCVELTKGNSKETITPRKYIHNYIGNEKLNTYKEAVRKGRNFEITSYTFDDPKSKTLRANLKQLDSLKIDGVWIDFKAESKKSNSMKVPKAIEYSEKDFNFMFEKLIGVTQWHGYTAYQSPHPGIDFGSVKEKVIAPASGYIRFLGWDNYGGHCKSGGNVARIEHDNGMHTVYMHMKNFKKQTSGTWEIGERIKKGQQLGISGNSGYWNCQSFGYHLHFELRKDRYQRNHVDPVPFINVNWDKIPTIGWQTYPGRLTGDNPHPGY